MSRECKSSMAAPVIRQRFALDTNILIDLGEGKEFAHALLRAYKSKGLAVPPTVVQELTNVALNHLPPANRFALAALSKMREWEIYPYDLKSVGHGIAEQDANKLMESGLIPDHEFNDGLIVIEAALACIPTLVTSDVHLLGINPPALVQALSEYDLNPVQIVHPKELLRAYRNSLRPTVVK